MCWFWLGFFTTSHRQAGVQPPPGKQGSLMHNSYLGRQAPSLRTSPPSFFFPQLYMLSMTSYGMEYPLGQLWSAVAAVSPPNSLCSPSLFTGGAVWEAVKALTLCKHCSAITTTSLCVNPVFSTNPKHSPYQLLWRKLTLPQPQPAHSPPLTPYHLCHAQVLHYPIHSH